MTKYAMHRPSKLQRLRRSLGVIVIVVLLVIVAGSLAGYFVYQQQLAAASSSSMTQLITVPSGSSVAQVGAQLQAAHLIKSSWAFQLYIHITGISNRLEAGTYDVSPNEGTKQIISTLMKGKVASRLVTILPGRRIDQVQADLINDGFSPASVSAALQPAQYRSLPVLAYLPASVSSLEGLLWPDSFEKTTTTQPSTIIEESLQEMNLHLTPAIQAEFGSEGLSVYQGITLASIIQEEVSKPSDQAQAAQVFLTRLKDTISLGSDAAANYGAIIAGHAPSLSYDSPYNTLLHSGLPPTPIASISSSALQAATHPAATNWLYFVTGDNGTTYFSTTLAQQQANTAEYCHKLCAEP
jgi:UPF0755 protein